MGLKGGDTLVLIGLTGYARVGKDSFANGLVEQHGFVKVAFAGALKELALKINPIVLAWTNDLDPIRWHTEISRLEWPEDDLKTNTNYRDFLKALGNGVRDISPGFWIRAALDKDFILENDVVVTDCRFLNEAAAIRDQDGYLIRIVRDGYGPESMFEKEVDLIEVDAVVGAPDVPGLHALVDPTLGALARVPR